MILRRQTVVLLLLVPLAIFLGIAAGYREFGEGRDYFAYIMVYEDIRLTDTLDVVRFEPGYMLSVWGSKFILGLQFEVFFSLLSMGALLVKFVLFSRHQRPIFTSVFYLCSWYPLHEYTQIRTAVALAFGLLAADFFFRRKYIVFSLLIALAFSFHSSAIILAAAVPGAYMLSRFPLPLVIAVIAGMTIGVGGMAVAILSLAGQFNVLISAYVDNLEGYKVNIWSGANLLTLGLLAAINLSGSLKTRQENTFFILAVSALAAAIAFQTVPVLSHRIREMLLVFLIPLAFNGALTKRATLQYALATTLAGWNLYSALSQGIIGGAS
ncbi:MAG: EpsG family protein [Rhodobacteraceae bacterium]|nr:EpsG family protein [Paracoccaceae bacterium]